MRPGDVLIGRDGKQRFVLKTEQDFVSGFEVINLTIDQDHTFAVGPDALLVEGKTGQNYLSTSPVPSAIAHSLQTDENDQ